MIVPYSKLITGGLIYTFPPFRDLPLVSTFVGSFEPFSNVPLTTASVDSEWNVPSSQWANSDTHNAHRIHSVVPHSHVRQRLNSRANGQSD